MPAYVTLFNFTEQGVKNVKDSVQRGRGIAQAAESMGGRFIGIWWLLGQYDGVVILEAPDEVSATRLLLMAGMQGNVTTETMRAFSEEEMENILQGLP